MKKIEEYKLELLLLLLYGGLFIVGFLVTV